jgi:hypothetical protein
MNPTNYRAMMVATTDTGDKADATTVGWVPQET